MNFIKKNTFFVIVTSMVVVIISFAFAISFKSMVLVAESLHVSIPYLYPLLFELTSVVGGAIKAYLEIKGIDDKFTKGVANVMLYVGVLLSVALNVYHVVEYMSVDNILESFFLVIAHSVPSLLVVGGAEVVIALGKHTFSNNETTDTLNNRIQELISELQTTNTSLKTVTGQNTTLIAQNNTRGEQLKKFNDMPDLLKMILAVYNDDVDIDELKKLGFTQSRYTRMKNDMDSK